MAAYATIEDIEARMARSLTDSERAICATLLEDAAIIIDSCNKDAKSDVKEMVSCRMVIRSLGDGYSDIPMGASQGSMSGLGYSQSWTMGSGGSAGEIYLSKTEKRILGAGNKIGSYSPVEEICYERD